MTDGSRPPAAPEITRAFSNDAIAFADRPVPLCSRPMLVWISARSVRNWVTDGFSRASRSKIRAGLFVRRHRLRQSSRLILQVADVVLAPGQFALELGDRWVFSREPLPYRSGPLERLRSPPPVGPSTPAYADVIVAPGQFVLELRSPTGSRARAAARIASDSSKARRASCLSPISSVMLAQLETRRRQAGERVGRRLLIRLEPVPQLLKNSCGSFSSVARSLASAGLFFSSGVSRTTSP